MKILREFSTLKEFYPEINPYVEAYKMRDNMWAIYEETFDGMGDPWMYLINGPKKALLIDTGFGIGDLKGLCQHLVGDKEIIVANTHHHFDHAYGNAQFDICYCHEDEIFNMKRTMNPHIWDYLYDENKQGIYSEFDVNDIIEYKYYHLIGLKSNETIDLGDDYLVECIPLRGHTSGQCGWLDHQTGCLMIGDTTSCGRTFEGDPHPENGCVERLRDDFFAIVQRMNEISGVFPGHGMLDQTPIILQYTLDTLNAIMENPNNYDQQKKIVLPHKTIISYTKNIHQGTAIKYNPNAVYLKR